MESRRDSAEAAFSPFSEAGASPGASAGASARGASAGASPCGTLEGASPCGVSGGGTRSVLCAVRCRLLGLETLSALCRLLGGRLCLLRESLEVIGELLERLDEAVEVHVGGLLSVEEGRLCGGHVNESTKCSCFLTRANAESPDSSLNIPGT